MVPTLKTESAEEIKRALQSCTAGATISFSWFALRQREPIFSEKEMTWVTWTGTLVEKMKKNWRVQYPAGLQCMAPEESELASGIAVRHWPPEASIIVRDVVIESGDHTCCGEIIDVSVGKKE